MMLDHSLLFVDSYKALNLLEDGFPVDCNEYSSCGETQILDWERVCPVSCEHVAPLGLPLMSQTCSL